MMTIHHCNTIMLHLLRIINLYRGILTKTILLLQQNCIIRMNSNSITTAAIIQLHLQIFLLHYYILLLLLLLLGVIRRHYIIYRLYCSHIIILHHLILLPKMQRLRLLLLQPRTIINTTNIILHHHIHHLCTIIKCHRMVCHHQFQQ
jgi:hypothetical protein